MLPVGLRRECDYCQSYGGVVDNFEINFLFAFDKVCLYNISILTPVYMEYLIKFDE